MTTSNSYSPPPLAYNIPDLAKASGRGRSVIFEEIAAGRLIARKAGGKLIVLYDDAVAWLQALPVREPKHSTT
ncbi:MAG: DNA-binding protein [Bosea sp. (in: a-proteobacteria)]|uniref:DNA-binding protein n=1 Tax=Bosea sp. (in: a-proteobacteria) TaxID=1871050 RepID=UPI002734817B|nr:DNA-binding protein [Bosea sp. (in: a-proteobacteria)]MDP3600950.1 DNA-binding protein [Bosea sp. (in: a-proteobacteria)]